MKSGRKEKLLPNKREEREKGKNKLNSILAHIFNLKFNCDYNYYRVKNEAFYMLYNLNIM